MSGSIWTFSSGIIAGRVSLDDSKHRAAEVITTGIMNAVLSRSCSSAEKHAVWNLLCRKVLSIQLCSRYPTMRFGKELGCLWIRRKNSMSVEICVVLRSRVRGVRSTEEWCALW